MKFSISTTTIKPMLEFIKNLKNKNASFDELEEILNCEDYKMEFSRYEGRVKKEEFIEYIFNFPNLKESQIKNVDLKAHHKYYLDLFANFEHYYDQYNELIKKLDREIFKKQIKLALKGLPDNFQLEELNYVFTIGIGQSYGYVHENNMHFDYLRTTKDRSIDELSRIISHETHHVGLNKFIDENIDLDNLPLEHLFYLYFTGEGLAVKYCNNAKGIMSDAIYDGEVNIGLDKFTWDYLNSDFEKIMNHFLQTIKLIRNGMSKEDFEKELEQYWMNPYLENQSHDEVPKLLHFRLYSLGNEIWGIIHDVFGKEKVYQTMLHMNHFVEVYNQALEKKGFSLYKINYHS